MGTFRVEVEVGDPAGRRYERVEALVDTGATYTSLARPLLETLGVEPHASGNFVLADGRHVEREIGRTWLRIDGRTEMTLVVFADPGSPALLGAYALEGLRLAADPVARRLVPVPGLLLPLAAAAGDQAGPRSDHEAGSISDPQFRKSRSKVNAPPSSGRLRAVVPIASE